MKRFAISMATVLLLCVATSSASAAPAVTLSATTLAPTASVTITGTGFDPSASVDVFLDTTDVALAVSKATGGVSYTFQLPASTQPGTHWITLDELRTHAAAQAAINVTTSWPQSGWGPSKRSFNPYENTIDTSNVSQLVRVWSQPLDGFGNSKPPIFYGRNVYVRDADQVIRAFSDAGKLLWTATTPFSSFPDSLTPA